MALRKPFGTPTRPRHLPPQSEEYRGHSGSRVPTWTAAVALAVLVTLAASGSAHAAGTPTLDAPVLHGTGGPAVAIDFTLPEAAQAGSVKLTFDRFPTGSYAITFAATEETSGQHTFTIDLSNPTASAHVASGDPVPEGPYVTVTFEYKDSGGNVGSTQLVGDFFTPAFFVLFPPAPTLTKPVANAIAPNPVDVEFTLPGPPFSGSLTVTFAGTNTTRILAVTDIATSFSFDPTDPTASPFVTGVQGGTTIPDGTYTVTVEYQDAQGDPGSLGPHAGVIIDTTAPQISVPPASPLRTALAGPLANYTALANVVDANPDTVTQSPTVGTVVTPGIRTITLTATDGAGNQASTTFDLEVRTPNPVNTRKLGTGDLAPGAGVFPGLPADARLATFSTPAIDDEGNIAFLAGWTSVSGSPKKGTGIFYNDTCLAVTGGDASVVAAGATWKIFSDPVVSGGHVVTIAKLNGVKAVGSALVGTITGSTLEKIARAGEVAPGTGGATFKSFAAGTVQDAIGTPRVAFLAALNAGTGTPIVSGANDVGLWYVEAGSTSLVFREGDVVAGKTIKTLQSFLASKDSAGCGRGTLVNSTITGDPLVSTRALFTDKSQGILTQNVEDGPPSVALSLSGDTATGLDAGGAFSSYGTPTRSEEESVAFTGTLALGNGATKANAVGIFTGPNVDGKFTSVARLSGDASLAGPGATFTKLSDPVLNEDGDLAFLATVKLKSPASSTLWWQPAGGALTLLAQGGTRPGSDLPADAKFKSFTSLAIAATGPIFVGTLVPGSGGVLKTNASGVWATDSAGAVRTLFRTGDTIGGKTVLSFRLLNATLGASGVTRSFNNNGQVAWVATFTDKTKAIVTTLLP